MGNSNGDRRSRTSSRASPSVTNAIGRLRPPEKSERRTSWLGGGNWGGLRREIYSHSAADKPAAANWADFQKFDQKQTCWRRLCLNHILTILISPDRKTEVQLRMGSAQCREFVKRTTAKRCTLPGLAVG